MIHVARDHFLNQFGSHVVVVPIMPAGKFVQHIKAELIAQVQKLCVRRIMRHAHGVHVHVFHRLEVQAMNRLAQTTT